MNCRKSKIRAMIILVLCLAQVFSGCSSQSVPGGEAAQAPRAITAGGAGTLTVTGDVKKEIVLNSYEGWTTAEIKYKEGTREVIPLLPVLSEAGITGEGATVFFSSPDGAIAGIPLEQISGNCWLRLSDEYGWQFISEEHPKQSGIKHMDYIVVSASQPGTEERCIRIIDGMNEVTITYGQLFAADGINRMVLEGEAKKGELTTNVYSRRVLVPIAGYLTCADKEEALEAECRAEAVNDESAGGKAEAGEGKGIPAAALAYYGDGSQGEISLSGFFEWRGNSADYIGPNGKDRKKDIIGVWMDAPGISVTDVAPEALSALEKNRVLVILLDGLSYYDIEELKPAFLWGKNPRPARTVMPSVSSVALAAVLTGKLPDENGISAEKMREPSVDDMFVFASSMGKTSAMVEGSTKLINTSVEQLLNPDGNGNGSTDDEVFACAKEQLDAGADLVFVHFHGYDDVAHSYGPLSKEACAKLKELDDYVKQLCTGFYGTVIVIADHGQHRTEGDKLGEHGEFRLRDMTVPWIRFESEG
jgi:hypothetical protein